MCIIVHPESECLADIVVVVGGGGGGGTGPWNF